MTASQGSTSLARPPLLTLFVRRQITEKRARAHTTVVVYLLDEAIEQLVRSAEGRPLAEADAARIHDAVRTELAFLPNVTPPGILAWDDVRAQLASAGRARAASFPWARTAEATAAVFRALAERRRLRARHRRPARVGRRR